MFSSFLGAMAEEISRVEKKHKPLNSLHEAYAVLAEEVDELWDEVKKKRRHRDDDAIYSELVQIATAAWRTARDLGYEPKEGELL